MYNIDIGIRLFFLYLFTLEYVHTSLFGVEYMPITTTASSMTTESIKSITFVTTFPSPLADASYKVGMNY